MPGGGTLTIAADRVTLVAEALPSCDAVPGEFVRISVADTGHGIDDAIRDRLFEPFFTTKEVGKGTGLGLSMVHGIMRQHDGWVMVDSELGCGSRFTLYLPATGAAVCPRTPVATRLPTEPALVPSLIETPAPYPSATILLVDDESMIRTLGRAILESQNYDVIDAVDGVEAVEIFEREHDRIALVLLDVTMPRLSGRDAFLQMKLIDPDVRVLFSSGYSQDDLSGIDGAAGLLTKPYRPADLLHAIRKALRHTRELTPV